MANKDLFKTAGNVAKNVGPTDTVNEAGGTAYKFTAKHALAQLAHTGTFHDGFYVSGADQLTSMLKLLQDPSVTPLFVGKLAMYARQRGFMKDMPAFLAAWLVTQGVGGRDILKETFNHTIDNGRMIRNFVQFIRSGVLGRKSLGSFPKRLVQQWLQSRTPQNLFRQSVGNDPSLSDVIKMAHPNPGKDQTLAATFAYLTGPEVHKSDRRRFNPEHLPALITEYEAWKQDTTLPVPKVPFQMLTHATLSEEQWKAICENGGWHFIRMNLNTFQRHNVFNFAGMEDFVADRLRDKDAIAKAKVFPYQLLAAFMFTSSDIPFKVRDSLHDAMDIAISNVPKLGKVFVCCDVSGSMNGAPVTGNRGSATSAVKAIDVAALVSSAILRQNPGSEVYAFSDQGYKVDLDPRDTVMTNVAKLKALPSYGTNCSAALAKINAAGGQGDVVIYVSDNESWLDTPGLTYNRRSYFGRQHGSETMAEWEKFRKKNPRARLVNIDTAANFSTQTSDRGDIMNIGGFSDQVFDVIRDFMSGDYGASAWLAKIESLALEGKGHSA